MARTSSSCERKSPHRSRSPVEELDKKIIPVEKIYAIVDHTRCLAYMLGDCIVPSNVREGYLARLVIRRTLRMMHDLDLEIDLADLVDRADGASSGRRVLSRRTRWSGRSLSARWSGTGRPWNGAPGLSSRLQRPTRKKNQPIPLAEVITLYDSHGIPPEMVKDIAGKGGRGGRGPGRLLLPDRRPPCRAKPMPPKTLWRSTGTGSRSSPQHARSTTKPRVRWSSRPRSSTSSTGSP